MLILDKNLATRESAKVLFAKVVSENILSLDFRKVEIISRSFANEFVKLEKENKLLIVKKNLSKDNKTMFDYADKVLDSDILSKNKYTTISLKQYESMI